LTCPVAEHLILLSLLVRGAGAYRQLELEIGVVGACVSWH